MLAVPHTGYQVGDRLYRGENVPKAEAAEKPQQVWLYAEDEKHARAAMEAAKRAFQALRMRSQAPDREREAHPGPAVSGRGSASLGASTPDVRHAVQKLRAPYHSRKAAPP